MQECSELGVIAAGAGALPGARRRCEAGKRTHGPGTRTCLALLAATALLALAAPAQAQTTTVTQSGAGATWSLVGENTVAAGQQTYTYTLTRTVFTRAQFCHYFHTHRKRAERFVKVLLDRKAAVESEWPLVNGGGKTCRISSKLIYRALGVEDIRHRRKAGNPVIMRRLLSLDFVLEHPGMNWLPAEPEKVEFFEKLGLPRRLIPRRIYYGVAGNQKRYFALKLPLAVDPETVTFAYVNPGHQTDTELHSWGAAHGPLWDALRKKGRQVWVIGIGVENATVDRTARVLEAWAAAEPGTPDEGLTVKQEIKAIDDAMTQKDREFLARYGGFGGAMQRSAALQSLPEAKVTEGVSIDDYSTWRAVRFADRDEIG